ncbi:hypothetical protein IHV12_04960 [Fictibacillus sp. 7GRE50]|uniref:hypothetical protein n=1 Tax=Fictibacillus sp. 7GRE50 TaxID=2745878 RepID=UPI0018CD0791|nr:hypothetical protein [Fictibacillus sp. 7GRE50]MBH0164253.1 hypothetical protein [Fictibacillus sp. 7GRE50]
MPGITFNIKGEKKTILFDEEINKYLRKREVDGRKSGILLNLDPYGECEFASSEIQSLILLCDELKVKYNDEFNWEHGRVRKFCKKFKELCVEAIEKKMNIEGSGD